MRRPQKRDDVRRSGDLAVGEGVTLRKYEVGESSSRLVNRQTTLMPSLNPMSDMVIDALRNRVIDERQEEDRRLEEMIHDMTSERLRNSGTFSKS